MAKEEKVESKVEVKEKTVSVEMSPEQKQAFVEFMAKRDADEAEAKAKEAIKAENDRPAVVNLRFRHSIDVRCCFIQNQKFWICQDGTGN